MSEHCQDALDRLYAYLDRELDAEKATEIREHLGDCPPCGEAFAFEERLLVTIRGGLREEIPPVLIDRLRAALRPPAV
jgi:mycothiol system anti-sigma-R factor